MTMRISRNTLVRGWLCSTIAGAIVYAGLMFLDLELKVETGVATAGLGSLSSAIQYRLAFHAWEGRSYAAHAGFDLGLAYVVMPLYAASFFFSGVLVAERFTPGRHPLRRWVLLAAMVAPVGAILDAAAKSLQFAMLLSGPSAFSAHLAAGLTNGRNVAVAVGLALLLGALAARLNPVKTQKGQRPPAA
ncbi:MAG: hypothetical protein ACREFW_09865 [Rhizomicrobium sp.]